MKEADAGKKESPKPLEATIMVVDDEVGFRELMTFELQSRGYKIAAAANGDEAVQRAEKGGIDVVVSDLTMPKKGGLDTLSALKKIDPRIEVILATGYATLENAVEGMKRGAYDFITKPFQVDDLARLIERALEKRRLSSKVSELEEINRFKSEFLANMSHELRTPMNAILGYTSLHLDRIYGQVTEKQEDALKRVEAAGKNLLQLINSILDLSKVTAGRMPVYLEDFNLSELTKEVVTMMDVLARAKKLELKWDVPADVRIRSDKTKVKQVLINLVTNAIKFTASGGVHIEARRAPEASQIRIRVRDTGIGIKAEDMPLLFQEFRQLDNSSTREYGGTGLGLAISKKFVELMGGTIEVESKVGSGTTFTVLLPYESQEPRAEGADLKTPAGGKAKVLLAIDDDPEVLKLLKDSLHGTAYGFAGALTGEDGIAAAREIKPFAITLDIMMPHRDGWSVLQALKNDPELRSIPIIMVSILDNRKLGFALGVADYIIKPFERVELLDKLRLVDTMRARQAPSGKQARRVLVVEDEAAVADYLSETLRSQGYQVEFTTRGEEAMARLKDGQPPDILFLDLMIPGMNGFDLIDSIGKDPNLKKIHVIALTNQNLSAQEADRLEEKVEMIVHKGSKNLSETLAAVKKRLDALGEGRP